MRLVLKVISNLSLFLPLIIAATIAIINLSLIFLRDRLGLQATSIAILSSTLGFGLALLLSWNISRSAKTLGILSSQNRLLTVLRKLDTVMLSTLEITPLCRNIVDLANEELGYIIVGIALIEDNKRLRRMAISQTHNPKLRSVLAKLPIPYEKQTVDMTNQQNLLIKAILEKKNYETDKLYDIQHGIFPRHISDQIQKDLNVKDLFIYPLIAKDHVLGVIYHLTEIARKDLSDVEYTLMQEFAAQVARVLDNAILYQSLKADREIIGSERNKMAITLAGISDAVIAINENHNIIIFNHAAQVLTGYLENEVLNKPVDSFIKVYDENKNELSPLDYCPTNQPPGPEGVVFSKNQLRVIGKGKAAYVNFISSQIRLGPNANLGFILTLHNVTKEKELDKMRLDFVSMAAHELRTPLTAIKGYLDVLKNEAGLKGERQQFIDKSLYASNQLTYLINNLLSVSRIERGAMTMNTVKKNLVGLVKDAVLEFTWMAKGKDLGLTFSEPTTPIPEAKVDELRIKEVLSNLLSNAVSYTPRGGKITVWVEAADGEVITHIKDTGIGIPKEVIPHLFTKFFRVTSALEQGIKGTGLGLYISKSIIELHHGKIWVESEAGKGSTFSFSLPITTENKPVMVAAQF